MGGGGGGGGGGILVRVESCSIDQSVFVGSTMGVKSADSCSSDQSLCLCVCLGVGGWTGRQHGCAAWTSLFCLGCSLLMCDWA